MANPPWVDVGQLVSLCHLLGQVGNTGATVAPHLHLETRYGPPGEVLSSLGCCGTDIPEEEQKEYFYWVTSGVFQHFDPMIIFKAFQDYSQ
jgi:murein DD-endopeptidase MepM/ murein hydrolase activator NlpD